MILKVHVKADSSASQSKSDAFASCSPTARDGQSSVPAQHPWWQWQVMFMEEPQLQCMTWPSIGLLISVGQLGSQGMDGARVKARLSWPFAPLH